MFRFVFASSFPAVLLALACLWGGVWAWVALVSVTGFVVAADRLFMTASDDREDTHRSGVWVSLILFTAHIVLLPLCLWALAAQGSGLSPVEKAVVFVTAGIWLGQISNSNAHELIHSRRRSLHTLGAILYTSLLHGHHTSAHLRVHHVFAASPDDPSTAPMGMGFYGFLARASWGEFRAGWRAEAKRYKGMRHPYVWYIAGGLVCLCATAFAFGGKGVLFYLGLAAYAQLQLHLSDYVQHYGLSRARRIDGRLEPMGNAHSWNSPRWYSAAMMLNAPRHSDHHLNPARGFPDLQLKDTMPMLPRSIPVMAVIALVPPWWRRVMDPRVRKWQKSPPPLA